MTPARVRPIDSDPFARAIVLGIIAGGLSGALVSATTVPTPPAGADMPWYADAVLVAVEAAAVVCGGGVVGLFAGLVEGAVLASPRVRDRWVRVVGAATAVGPGVLLAIVVPLPVVDRWLLPLWCLLLGAVLAPAAAFGVRPVRGSATLSSLVGRNLSWGSGVGADVGMLVGLAIGVRYVPLVWASVIEAGIFGAVIGTAIALVALAAYCLFTVRVQPPPARRHRR